MSDKLLPCPFCGSPPVLVEIEPHSHSWATFMPHHSGSAYIECGCGAGLIDDDAASVTKRWNARAAASAEPDDDETYEIGVRDGYEKAIQTLDLLTGGDGEFVGSTVPGRTVDVPVMQARIVEKYTSGIAAASAEPVAWRCYDLIYNDGRYYVTNDRELVASRKTYPDYWRIEPLYTHPAPDAEIVAALSDAILHLRFAQSGFETPEIDNDWLNKRDEIVRTGETLLAKAKGGSVPR